MTIESESVSVRPLSKRNGLTLTWLGGLSLLLGLGLFLTWPTLFAVGLMFFSLGAISLILGLAKVYEPETTLALDDKGLTYFHRRGKVSIDWDNIQRVDIPRVTNGLDTIELSYLGIKLKHLNPILDNISPSDRLINRAAAFIGDCSLARCGLSDFRNLSRRRVWSFGDRRGSLSRCIGDVWASLRDVRHAFRLSLVYSPRQFGQRS